MNNRYYIAFNTIVSSAYEAVSTLHTHKETAAQVRVSLEHMCP